MHFTTDRKGGVAITLGVCPVKGMCRHNRLNPGYDA